MIPIYPNNDESKRIAFFDRLLAYGTEELHEVMEAEEIIWKLKGVKPDDSSGIIRKIVDNNSYLLTELTASRNNISILQSDLYMVKEDLRKLVKAISTLASATYSQELYELKQKHNIY